MKGNNVRQDRTSASRKARQRAREKAAGFSHVSLKVPTDQIDYFRQLAAAAVTAREPPGRQQAGE
jgi:hypothetical protein